MYARVARWEGAGADTVRATAQAINAEAASGPPEGLPAKALLLLIDPDGAGPWPSASSRPKRTCAGPRDAERHEPAGDGMGQRTSVEMYEVAADLRM